jgi:hypothetical protein
MWGKVAFGGACAIFCAFAVGCEGEHRPYVAVNGARPGSGPNDASANGVGVLGSSGECSPGVDGECPLLPMLQRGTACSTDLDCGAPFPSCVDSRCACSLSTAQLASDPKNCGACGNDCAQFASSASCEQGRCTLPGEPKPNDVAQSPLGNSATLSLVAASGAVLKSPKYSLQVSVGQSPGGNTVLRSNRFQVRGGLVGASR